MHLSRWLCGANPAEHCTAYDNSLNIVANAVAVRTLADTTSCQRHCVTIILLMPVNQGCISISASFDINHLPVKLLDSDASPPGVVRNLRRVTSDSDLGLSQRISGIRKSCLDHTRDIRQIRRHVSLSTAKTTVISSVSMIAFHCLGTSLNMTYPNSASRAELCVHMLFYSRVSSSSQYLLSTVFQLPLQSD